MEDLIEKTQGVLYDAVKNCTAEHICLSGGLDSTILAFLLKERKMNAISVICKDFISTDLTYCQLAAQKFNIPLSLKMCNTSEITSAIDETILILKNFNDMEIRNNVVAYLAFIELKKKGFSKIITGDGADEIFAGYNFLLNKTADELKMDLKRISKIMHFPSHKIGQSLGIKVESPFCDSEVIKFAKSVPVDLLVGQKDGKKYGKWILRKAFEAKIPPSIAWRQKVPMQEGAGTQSLTAFFDAVIPDRVFFEKIKKIKQDDGVIIRTKESLHYYQAYRRYYELEIAEESKISCPDCKYGLVSGSKFCKMCGKYPV